MHWRVSTVSKLSRSNSKYPSSLFPTMNYSVSGRYLLQHLHVLLLLSSSLSSSSSLLLLFLILFISLHRHTGGEDGGRDTHSAPAIYVSQQFGGRHRQGILGRGHPTWEYSSGYQDICSQEMQTLAGAWLSGKRDLGVSGQHHHVICMSVHWGWPVAVCHHCRVLLWPLSVFASLASCFSGALCSVSSCTWGKNLLSWGKKKVIYCEALAENHFLNHCTILIRRPYCIQSREDLQGG